MSKPWWFRVDANAILSSPRCRSLSYEELGLWFALMLAGFSATGRECALRTGSRAWTEDDLAYQLGLDRRRKARLLVRLRKLLELGLVARATDGALFVPRFEEHQQPSRPVNDAAFLGRVVSDLTHSTRPPRGRRSQR